MNNVCINNINVNNADNLTSEQIDFALKYWNEKFLPDMKKCVENGELDANIYEQMSSPIYYDEYYNVYRFDFFFKTNEQLEQLDKEYYEAGFEDSAFRDMTNDECAESFNCFDALRTKDGIWCFGYWLN